MSEEVAGTNSVPVTVESEGVTVTSTSETPEAITETLQSDPVADAAATLGKRSAEARKARQSNDVGDGGVREHDGSTDSGVDGPGGSEESGKPLDKPRHDPREDPRLSAKARLEKALEVEKVAKREAREAREEAARYKAELEGLRAPKAPEPVPQPQGKPKADDYATYDEWVDAVTDWKVEEQFKQREAQYQQQAQVQKYVSDIDEVLGQAVAARKEYEAVDPQWFGRVSDEVKQIANQPSIARDLEEKLRADHVIADEIILAGQAGPKVMVHLSENPQELERMRGHKTPIDIQLDMRMLARTLNGSGAPQVAPQRTNVSQAKAPIRPVNGAPGGVEGPPGEDASYEEHKRYYNRVDKAARR